MKKKKKIAKAHRSLKKSGVAAKEGKEGIYASTSSANQSKKIDDGLGLTLLPGSQIFENAVDEEQIIDPAVALQDGVDPECPGPMRSNRLAGRADRNLSSCFTPTTQSRVLKDNQPPIIRNSLCGLAEFSSANTIPASSSVTSSIPTSSCSPSTIKLSSCNHKLALQTRLILSPQLSSSSRPIPRSSKPLGIARMDFFDTGGSPDDIGDFGGPMDQWSTEPGGWYHSIYFEALFPNLPATPKAHATFDNEQITGTLAGSENQHSIVKDTNGLSAHESMASTINTIGSVKISTLSDNHYFMDTSSASATPATLNTPASMVTPATVCTPATVFTPETLDSPAVTTNEHIFLDNSNDTMTQGYANFNDQVNDSMDYSMDYYFADADATPSKSYYQHTAAHDTDDTDNTLTDGHGNFILPSNGPVECSAAFSNQYVIASDGDNYNQYQTNGDNDVTMANAHAISTVQTNEPSQAPITLGTLDPVANASNSYSQFTEVVSRDYTTTQGNGASPYEANGRRINQISPMSSNELISSPNPGSAEHSVATKVNTNDPDLRLKLLRKQHVMLEHYEIEKKKYKATHKRYKVAIEKHMAINDQRETEIQQYKADIQQYKAETQQYKAEHQFLEAQKEDLDNQLLRHKKNFDTYRATCAKVIDGMKDEPTANAATPTQADVARLRQIASQASLFAGKAKDEIYGLKTECQTLNEQLKASRDIIARLTKDRDNWKNMAEGWSHVAHTQPQVSSSSVKKVLAAYAPASPSLVSQDLHAQQPHSSYDQNLRPSHAQNIQPGQAQQMQLKHAQHNRPGQAQQAQVNHSQHIQVNHAQNIQRGQYQQIQSKHAQQLQPGQAQRVQLNRSQHMQPSQNQQIQVNHAQYIQPGQDQQIQLKHAQQISSGPAQQIQGNHIQYLQSGQAQQICTNHIQNVQPNRSQHFQTNHSQHIQSSHAQHVQIDLTQDTELDHIQYNQPSLAQHAQSNNTQHIQLDHGTSDNAQHPRQKYNHPTASDSVRDKPKGWWLDPNAHGTVVVGHPTLRDLNGKRSAKGAKLQERAKKERATDKATRAAHKAAARLRMKEDKARAATEEVLEDGVGEEEDLNTVTDDEFADAMDTAFAEIDAGDENPDKEWTDEDGFRLMVALKADLEKNEAKKEAAGEAADDHDSLFDE
ncbi:hypothetical protein MMC34_005526 [Xylographa carneopallida]|nr:hypothetical protein [Xylographa carneopallida]